jgi:PBP1b-binding outer membrane lipoprotein LpoB
MRKLILAAVVGTAFALAGCSEKAEEAAPAEAMASEPAADAMASEPAADAMASEPAADAMASEPAAATEEKKM